MSSLPAVASVDMYLPRAYPTEFGQVLVSQTLLSTLDYFIPSGGIAISIIKAGAIALSTFNSAKIGVHIDTPANHNHCRYTIPIGAACGLIAAVSAGVIGTSTASLWAGGIVACGTGRLLAKIYNNILP